MRVANSSVLARERAVHQSPARRFPNLRTFGSGYGLGGSTSHLLAARERACHVLGVLDATRRIPTFMVAVDAARRGALDVLIYEEQNGRDAQGGLTDYVWNRSTWSGKLSAISPDRRLKNEKKNGGILPRPATATRCPTPTRADHREAMSGMPVQDIARYGIGVDTSI